MIFTLCSVSNFSGFVYRNHISLETSPPMDSVYAETNTFVFGEYVSLRLVSQAESPLSL